MMNKRYLTFIFLLVAILLGSFNSFAHDVQSGDESDCHLADHAPVEKGGLPDHSPDSHTDGCCDCEDFCEDVTELSSFCGLEVTVSVRQLFYPPANSFFPKVYPAIFVPPQAAS